MSPSPTTELGMLQATIDQLMDSLRLAGGRLDVHHDLSAYRVLCEGHRLWRDPALVAASLGKLDGAFWLGFSDERQQLVALAAGRLVETVDFHHTIETGELWHNGGFRQQQGLADQRAIARVDAMPPSRDLAGPISYLQIQMLKRGRDLPEFGWMVSWLTQALAFRTHRSRFAVSLVHSGPQNDTARESFARCEFCLSGYFPPMETAATLHLCHTSLAEYLAWGRQIAVRSVPPVADHAAEDERLRAAS